jgi:Ca2+-binding EF-hand superfamily protein
VSGGLDKAEYGVAEVGFGAAGFWGDEEVGYGYQPWDIDGDGVILSNEFADGWGEVGMLGEWDADGDGSLSEDELTTGVYGEYDKDDSGVIEEPELTDVGDDMGDEGF